MQTITEINVKDVVAQAIQQGVEVAEQTDDKGSNGSEAFQYVALSVKGQRKVQNQLKKLDTVHHDSYYGYLITVCSAGQGDYGYYKGEAFCNAVATSLKQNGISAYAADRLL